MIEQEARYNGLTNWLQQVLSPTHWDITPLAGDASFRRYFRIVTANENYIAMDAPPALEDCRPFVAVLRVYEKHGIPVPRLIATAVEAGYLLMTDFGDQQFFKLITDQTADISKTINPLQTVSTFQTTNSYQTADTLYEIAFKSLFDIMRVPQDDGYHFPVFDSADFRRELSNCEEWFFRTHLRLSLSSAEQKMIDQQFSVLVHEAVSQPQVCVHRDYHSRNLMLAEGKLGVLDFQDAVMGPIAYDLVSLLRDCYITWSRERVESWVKQFYERLIDQKLLQKSTGFEQYLRWFDLAGLQRHLKCMFIFARKYHRDGTTAFLGDIPRIVNYALEVSERYADLQALQRFLTDHVVQNVALAVA